MLIPDFGPVKRFWWRLVIPFVAGLVTGGNPDRRAISSN